MDLMRSVSARLARVVSPNSGQTSKQLYFVAFVLAYTVVVAFSVAERVFSAQNLLALAVLVLDTGAASLLPWGRLASGWNVPDDPGVPPATQEYLAVANRNADQLMTLVTDLLQDHVNRHDDGGLVLRSAALSTLAREACESLAPRAAAEGVRLVSDIRETPETEMDSARVTQVLDNLLSNAVKYTPHGGTITVRTRTVDGAVEASVRDTGIGMTDEEVASLFTDYYRTPTAKNHHIGGHGIGLSLARRIVVTHGGQVSVRSTPGEGSEFTIRLPRDEARKVAAAQ